MNAMASRTRRSSGGRADAVAASLDRFAAERLAEVLALQRWFGSKGRRIVSVSVLKALYEVRYEIDNRPAWLDVPLRGLHHIVARAR